MTAVQAGVATVYTDMPEAEYHAHPALSSTGARKLLAPSCPALYKWERGHGQPPNPAFDFGHAAHSAVLGVGDPVTVIDFDDWRTKAAQQARDEARAAGCVPLLRGDAARVAAMTESIRSHPIAGPLFTPGTGSPEQSVFWDDTTWGVPRRARIDWTRPNADGGRVILADLKSTTDVSPAAISKTVATYGYHAQASYYLEAAAAADWDDDAVFLFVFVSKVAPYLVNVVELDALALRVGADLNNKAMQVWAECTASGVWPGYGTDVTLVGLPTWALNPSALDEEIL